MKIRFLFLIGIQLFLMFPRPGMQNISHATNRAGAKHYFCDDVFKLHIYKDMILNTELPKIRSITGDSLYIITPLTVTKRVNMK